MNVKLYVVQFSMQAENLNINSTAESKQYWLNVLFCSL